MGKLTDILTDESKWCKRSSGRTIKNDMVDWRHESACKWCLMGAIFKCFNFSSPEFETTREEYIMTISKLQKSIDFFYPHFRKHEDPIGTIIQFNDFKYTTWSDVQKVLQEAGV